ncbi:MAG TPA: HPr(Ser) kinase/phosphatase [Vicinamibacterales bacterium]|nr:HPr(Ser) kinase/phosphatase [Vicinamibacterales bacterium]
MQPQLTVAGLLESRSDAIGLPLELLSGIEGQERAITSPHIQKTGLALAGFHEYLQPGRILVFGESEVRYLDALDSDSLLNVLAAAFTHDIPCVLITGGWNPPPQLLAACERFHVPLLRTTIATPAAIAKIGVLLENALAVRQVVHGVLMDILSLGVLITGDSGIGKSECALDLVVRGHRLVADDAVEVRRRGETDLIGTCPELTRHHMEVRGLGVINIRDLFGVAATRTSKRMELVVQLERWDSAREYDRLGLEENLWELFGVRIPLVHMPVAPGRNLAILVEVAARNQLLRTRGLNAARDLAARLEQQLREADGDANADDDAEHGGPV